MKHISRIIDLAFCLLFLPLMIFAFPVERWWGGHPLFFCSFVGWLYVTYFLYKYLIVPLSFHGRRNRLRAFAAAAGSLLITFLFASYEISSPFYRPVESIPYPVWGVRQNQQAVWLHYIVVVTFCAAVGMLTEAYRQRLAREEVEYERNMAELALYKAQIDPHFLFNTLNTLYGLLITHSDKTEAALEGFIDLTKYMYNNAGRDFIPLAEEVEYIGQYIALQSLRLNEYAEVEFTREVENGAMPVPPMLLITFIENAFKYGISSNEPCFVRIRLHQRSDTLRFETENPIFAREAQSSGHTGIANCRRRLSLLYPDRYRLEIGERGEHVFRVLLELRNVAL